MCVFAHMRSGSYHWNNDTFSARGNEAGTVATRCLELTGTQVVVYGLQVGPAQAVATGRGNRRIGKNAVCADVQHRVTGTVDEAHFVAAGISGRGIPITVRGDIAAE